MYGVKVNGANRNSAIRLLLEVSQQSSSKNSLPEDETIMVGGVGMSNQSIKRWKTDLLRKREM